jgi:hypothetical protein
VIENVLARIEVEAVPWVCIKMQNEIVELTKFLEKKYILSLSLSIINNNIL